MAQLNDREDNGLTHLVAETAVLYIVASVLSLVSSLIIIMKVNECFCPPEILFQNPTQTERFHATSKILDALG